MKKSVLFILLMVPSLFSPAYGEEAWTLVYDRESQFPDVYQAYRICHGVDTEELNRLCSGYADGYVNSQIRVNVWNQVTATYCRVYCK